MASESEKPTPNYDPFPPGQSSRSMIVEIDAEDMGHMLRRAFTTSHGKFTIYCDEPEAMGAMALHRLRSFAASILF